MACRYFLGDKELNGDALTSYMKNLPHEEKLKVAPEIAKDSYSRLSWTPGEAQAARYDLSKSIDNIKYSPESQHVIAYDKTGNQVISKMNVAEKDLPDIVGKEAAEKLINSKNEEKLVGGTYKKLENADLKIGGEGMKGFYDSIIPKSIEKLTKGHGVKVKSAGIDVSGGKALNSRDHSGIFEDGVAQVHYIDIPQSLKDVVMKKGQPLFSAGFPLVRVDHDPFKKDKND